MHVLVTGGAGFIGSNFTRMALRGDFPSINKITVLDKITYAGNLDNLSFAENNPNFKFIQGDICDEDTVRAAYEGIDSVINFAAESHVDRSIDNATDFIRTNIQGVHVLLNACLEFAVARFLQVSTDEVYGTIAEGSWTEAEPLLPNSPYAASKACGDLLVRAFNQTHQLDTVITRCSNNYGPNQYPEKIIPLFISKLIKGEKVPIYGDGLNIRDWLHVDDHCRGIAIALNKGTSGEIYNIGGGVELTNLELARKLINPFGNFEEYAEYVSDRKGHDLRYSLNWEKISKLGYQPLVSFEAGLAETINQIRNQGK